MNVEDLPLSTVDMQFLLQHPDQTLKALESLSQKESNDSEKHFEKKSRHSFEESHRAVTEERSGSQTTVQQNGIYSPQLNHQRINVNLGSPGPSEKSAPITYSMDVFSGGGYPTKRQHFERRNSEQIAARDDNQMSILALSQADHARQHNCSVPYSEKYVEHDNELDTYQSGLMPTQDLQQQLYHQQLNRRQPSSDQQSLTRS